MTDKVIGKRLTRYWDDIDFKNLSPYNMNNLDDLNKISFFPNHMKYIKDMKEEAGYPRDQIMDWVTPTIHESEKQLWSSDPWSYRINRYGFRDVWKMKPGRKNIGFFGCSMTFGEGIETSKLWTTILAKRLKMNPFNFGIGGSGCARVARTFACVQQVLDLDYAVVLLPHPYRLEYAVKENRRNNTLINKNFLPGQEDPLFIDLHKAIYNIMNDNMAGLEVLRSAITITESAKAKGTKVVFASWDQFAWTVLDQANIPNLCTYLFKMLFKEKNDYARDGQHPGPIANEEWANTLYEWIKETKFTV